MDGSLGVGLIVRARGSCRADVDRDKEVTTQVRDPVDILVELERETG